MATVHMSLQGKGGVGKSFVASLLAQHFKSKGLKPKCYDTDPINPTFAGHKALGVTRLKLGETVDEINPRNFDTLMEAIFASDEQDCFVIDNGSGTYLSLITYMVENEVTQMLTDEGHEIIFHAIITGGQAYKDTVEGLEKLFKYFPETKCVIWLNEYFGSILENGTTFEQTKLCKDHEDNIYALVKLQQVRRETFGADIHEMMEQRKTFEEAIASDAFSMMSRQRLHRYSKRVFNTMAVAQL